MNFDEALKKRRSIYNLKKEINISDDELYELIENSVLHTPSAYNSQSQRVVIVLNDKHDKLWDMIKAELKKIVPEKNFPKTEKKMDGFKAGYGTVLYFNDRSVTEDLVNKFPLYKKNFLLWAEQQNGMLQANVWVALATKNIGASLQHYNEIIEKRLKSEFDIPDNWDLMAQMPFGNIKEQADEKSFIDIEKRLRVIK